ncbi:uncharacterized protein [Neodiprion pinetum]|uniref:uncharacterized protein n=1 Tax=Neodiprion pinetum TaxID=441929 RepID=UPI001EE0E973|nr:uncharacterized protein LOC124215924 [Neodiprion pinetum]XP_046475813.1 uncharacterized protein LOC124215924 [Neodiprion pinetum]
MSKLEDSFTWTHRLGCPPSICNESTKQTLSKGIVGLLWDHIADNLHPSSEVLEARKNILLHKLRENAEDSVIEIIKKTSKIRAERNDLRQRIRAAEEERETQEFLLRKKRQEFLKIQATRQSVQAKKELFSIKYDQMQSQVQDCNQMRQVCKCLLPSSGDKVDLIIIEESLTLVSSMLSGTDKKKVWKKISEILYPVATSVLWNILLQRRTTDIDRVVQLGYEISPNATPSNCGEKFEIGIAKACSLHVTAVSKRLLNDAKASEHQSTILEYIEKIEKAQTSHLDISEWLALTLEVRKWEAEQMGLHRAVKVFNENLEPQNELNAELNNIAIKMQQTDVEMRQCADDIQTSMALLKGAGATLNRAKEKLLNGLQKFAIFRAMHQDKTWLDIDLGIEIENFYERINMNALRKITLGAEVGAYRHSTCCIGQSGLAVTVPLDVNYIHDFPFVRAPLYHLLDCYKALMKSVWFANYKPSSPDPELQLNLIADMEEQWRLMSSRNYIRSFQELMNLADQASDKTQEHLQNFDATFEAWTNQVVSCILMSYENTVDGITFREWQQRFNIMASLLASKTKALK